jgi:acyl-CoA thioester hydrolase
VTTLVTYRGCVNSWECDQMGHMNVQFYVAKGADAQAGLAGLLGLTPSYLRKHHAAFASTTERIHFKRELHAGAPVSVRSGVRGIEGATIRYFSVLRNEETGEQSATFESSATLVHRETRKPIALPPEVAEKASEVAGKSVDHPHPRPIEGTRMPKVTPELTLLTQRSGTEVWEADENGAVTTRYQVARFSEAGIQFFSQIGLSKTVLVGRKLGAAAVDYDIHYLARLATGRNVDIRSGLLDVGRKVVRFYHHLIDTEKRELATTIEVALVFFDLAARKSVAMPQEVVEAARTLAVPPSR